MQNKSDTLRLTELSLFVAIVLLMKVTGLSSIPIGPLNMTLSMIPIALAAMLLGPLAGGIIGTIYGFTSFYDAITGASVMTGIFFQISPLNTVILCVIMRTIVGVSVGYLFRFYKSFDRTNTICYYLGGLTAPLLNTVLFMGYIVLVFYRTDYIQERISVLGAESPFAFVVLSVGVQGLIEALAGMFIGGSVGKSLAHILSKKKRK